jgi:hypothetical protein
MSKAKEMLQAKAMLQIMAKMEPIMAGKKAPTAKEALELQQIIRESGMEEEFAETMGALDKFIKHDAKKEKVSKPSENVVASMTIKLEKVEKADGTESVQLSITGEGFTTLERKGIPSLLREALDSQE